MVLEAVEAIKVKWIFKFSFRQLVYFLWIQIPFIWKLWYKVSTSLTTNFLGCIQNRLSFLFPCLDLLNGLTLFKEEKEKQ